MSTEHIVSLLIAERNRIQAAIAALQPSPKPVKETPALDFDYSAENVPEWVKPKILPAPKRKGMSAATHRKMAEGQKRRYAAIRAAKAEAAAPKLSKKLAEAVAPSPEETDFKKRMSEIMKKAWAKRKKATKK